jgi:hypothetical protein
MLFNITVTLALSIRISGDYQRKILSFFLNSIIRLVLVMETAFVS